MLCVGDRISPKCNKGIVEHVCDLFEDGGKQYAVCRWKLTNVNRIQDWKCEVREVEDIERFFVVNEEE